MFRLSSLITHFCFVLAITACLVPAAAAQSPKTVTDFFMAFPPTEYATGIDGKEYKSKEELSAFRRSLIKVEDTRNGYLRLEGAWEGWGEFALFKRTDGTYLIARTMVECGPECSGTMSFHEYKDGRWNDVTGSVFEAPDNDEVVAAVKRAKLGSEPVNMYYSLPRKGTDITVICSMCRNSDDVTLFRYSWRPPKFVRR